MKNLVVTAALLIICTLLTAQSETTQSPYFMVASSDSSVDALPLKTTTATVNIAGVIADVVVEQTYTNEGSKPLEAIYVFPGSTASAVYAMQMQIGNRIIEAQIEEKGKAREIYTQAKNEGKRTSLLEQHRPNVFQMNVANILPGDTIKVRLSYTELLVPDEGIYSFTYPAVVGPRYINKNEKTNTSFAAMPYKRAGEAPTYKFDLDVYLSTGVPLQSLKSTSHTITINKRDQNTASIELVPMDKNGNRDFVLNYTLKGNQIETGLLLFEDKQEKYFLCMVQPPKKVETNAIPPRDFIFIVDISGSMRGFPLDVSKKFLNDLISHLRPNDIFNVLLFAGSNQILSERSIPATSENIQKALNFLNQQQGGGGTELLGALRQGLAFPREAEGLARSIIVVTDGYVGVEPEAFDLVRKNLNQANLFSFGIGSSVNRHIIEGLAHVGQGLPTIILNPEEAPKAAEKFRRYIDSPLFTQVTAQFAGFDAYDIEPLTIPDVLSDRPIILFGKWRGTAKGKILLSGYTGNPDTAIPVALGSVGYTTEIVPGKKTMLSVNVNNASADKKLSALKYLWAREKLRRLSDYDYLWPDDARVKEITALGLEYHMLTAYTSFVAVDEDPARLADDNLSVVKQPLPMPEGVPNSAVGFTLDITGVSGVVNPSIFTIFLYAFFSAITLLILWFIFWRKRTGIPGSLIILAVVACHMSCKESKFEEVSAMDLPSDTINTITFILGTDEDSLNPYYRQSSLYFHQKSESEPQMVVEGIKSLESLHHYLSTNIPQRGPWQNINLVVHGNRWTGIGLPLDEKIKMRTNASSLRDALAKGDFTPYPAGVLTECTSINIYGCSVGLDTGLINQLAKYFTDQEGSTAVINASPYFNIFYRSKLAGQIEHIEAECYYVTYPIGKVIAMSEISGALKSKYPEEDIDWNKALQRSQPDESGQPYAYKFHVPVSWKVLFQNKNERPEFKWQDDLRQYVGQHSDISATLKQMDFKPEHFWWTAKPVEFQTSIFQTQPALDIKGSTRVHCVLVPAV